MFITVLTTATLLFHQWRGSPAFLNLFAPRPLQARCFSDFPFHKISGQFTTFKCRVASRQCNIYDCKTIFESFNSTVQISQSHKMRSKNLTKGTINFLNLRPLVHPLNAEHFSPIHWKFLALKSLSWQWFFFCLSNKTWHVSALAFKQALGRAQ